MQGMEKESAMSVLSFCHTVLILVVCCCTLESLNPGLYRCASEDTSRYRNQSLLQSSNGGVCCCRCASEGVQHPYMWCRFTPIIVCVAALRNHFLLSLWSDPIIVIIISFEVCRCPCCKDFWLHHWPFKRFLVTFLLHFIVCGPNPKIHLWLYPFAGGTCSTASSVGCFF